MITKFILLLSLIFAGALPLHAQQKKLADCRSIVVQDSDRRGFQESSSFNLDVDGDREADTITPRTYVVKNKRKATAKDGSKARENHWITFDLKTSRGRVVRSFFKYEYGTDWADYWVYAFVPCRINRDRRPDLLFYSGDDTSEESIVLVNTGSAFKVYSRKMRGLGE
jgi:hypothetical protein